MDTERQPTRDKRIQPWISSSLCTHSVNQVCNQKEDLSNPDTRITCLEPDTLQPWQLATQEEAAGAEAGAAAAGNTLVAIRPLKKSSELPSGCKA